MECTLCNKMERRYLPNGKVTYPVQTEDVGVGRRRHRATTQYICGWCTQKLLANRIADIPWEGGDIKQLFNNKRRFMRTKLQSKRRAKNGKH